MTSLHAPHGGTIRMTRAGWMCAAMLLGSSLPAAPLNPADMSGSGNFCPEIYRDQKAKTGTDVIAAQIRALRAAGGRRCRVNIYEYWRNGRPLADTPELDYILKSLHAGGITPMVLFEYYGKQPGGRAKWLAIGEAFARRWRPNSEYLVGQGIRDWGISVYSAMNEPDGDREKGMARTPADEAAKKLADPKGRYDGNYHDVLEALADGVHGVDATLAVIPGGFLGLNRDGNATCHGFGTAIADLLNNGKLDGIDLHTYNDNQWAPIVKSPTNVYFEFSPQANFDAFKRACGIKADINFYATEYGFKANSKENGRTITPEEAALGQLTCLWANLGVVKGDGTPATVFALTWNLFNTEATDPVYGMCRVLDPWQPTPKGRMFQAVMQLTAGMVLTHLDPKGRGEYVLEGGGRKLWVWQDYPKWSTVAGTSYTVTGLPAGTKQVQVYDGRGWDGPARTVAVPDGATTVTVDGLAPLGTYLFLAVP
jgi:hypothetical protein